VVDTYSLISMRSGSHLLYDVNTAQPQQM